MGLLGIPCMGFQTIRFDLRAYYASEWRSQFPLLVRIYYPWHKENNTLRKSSWNLEEADNGHIYLCNMKFKSEPERFTELTNCRPKAWLKYLTFTRQRAVIHFPSKCSRITHKTLAGVVKTACKCLFGCLNRVTATNLLMKRITLSGPVTFFCLPPWPLGKLLYKDNLV